MEQTIEANQKACGLSLMEIDTVTFDHEKQVIRIIDQTLLPGRIEVIELHTAQEIWDAIYRLQVRGAPAIGVTAGYGLYQLALAETEEDPQAFYNAVKKQADYLDSSRPTAVNLSWALKRMMACLGKAQAASDKKDDWLSAMGAEADAIWAEDISVCKKIGENGLPLLHDGAGVLTHCNAGKLAAVRYGTATAPVYVAREKGLKIRAYCDETRPLLQGARLTAYELSASGIDTTVLCDNMSASLLRTGAIDAVFVGCDRVAANGDTANKIGTSLLALAAKRYNVPFYVCAPTSTLDAATATGAQITIEQRAPEEVTELWYKERMAPEEVSVYNPAFDVTDHDLITGIITEYGIAYPPYTASLAEALAKKAEGVSVS